MQNTTRTYVCMIFAVAYALNSAEPLSAEIIVNSEGINIGGDEGGEYFEIKPKGTAELAGTLEISLDASDSVAPGESIQMLVADEGITGVFDQILDTDDRIYYRAVYLSALEVHLISGMKGDCNGDGIVNLFDFQGFILALIDPELFWLAPGLYSVDACDVDDDCDVDFDDIDDFADLIEGISAEELAAMIAAYMTVPEPSAVGMAIVVLVGLGIGLRRLP